MAVEIERKFLVRGAGWQVDVRHSEAIRQGYVFVTGEKSLRVRIVGDKSARLTLKTQRTAISRNEFEYEIPLADANELMTSCEGHLIEKRRYVVAWRGRLWVVDVFEGCNAGLVVAEIELASEHEEFPIPPWAGPEVTAEARYTNAALSRTPYCEWD